MCAVNVCVLVVGVLCVGGACGACLHCLGSDVTPPLRYFLPYRLMCFLMRTCEILCGVGLRLHLAQRGVPPAAEAASPVAATPPPLPPLVTTAVAAPLQPAMPVLQGLTVVPGVGGAAATATVRLLLDNPCAGTATPASCVALNDGDTVIRSDVPLTATTRTKLIEVPGLALDMLHELASVCKAIHGGGNASTYSDPLLLKLCSCPPAPTCTGDGATWQLCADLPDDAQVPSRLQLQSCVGEVALHDAPVATLPGPFGVGATVLPVAAVRQVRYRRAFELPDGMCPGPWSLPLVVSWMPQPIAVSSVETLTLDVTLDARIAGAAVAACVGFEVQRAASQAGLPAAAPLLVGPPGAGQSTAMYRYLVGRGGPLWGGVGWAGLAGGRALAVSCLLPGVWIPPSLRVLPSVVCGRCSVPPWPSQCAQCGRGVCMVAAMVSLRRFGGLPGGSEQWVRYRALYTAPGGAGVASEWCETASCRVVGIAPFAVEHVGHQRFSAGCAGAVVMTPPAQHVDVEVDGGTPACRVVTVLPGANATFGLTHMAAHTFRIRGVNEVGPGSWSEPVVPLGHTGNKVRTRCAVGGGCEVGGLWVMIGGKRRVASCLVFSLACWTMQSGWRELFCVAGCVRKWVHVSCCL